jgi:hypothetical protein
MSRAALLLIVPVLMSCTKKDAAPADTSSAMGAASAPAAATAPAPAAATPMNVAGKWTVNVMPEGKDSSVLVYTLEATNDRTGWKMTLPNRKPMDVRVTSMSNDSVVVENGPYSSALQKGVMVTTNSVMHMEGDKLVGKTIAHYSMKGPDSVRVLRTVGTRM